jgi:hypothetical protein
LLRRRKLNGLRIRTKSRRNGAVASRGARNGLKSDLPIVGVSRIRGVLVIARRRSGRRRRAL